MKAKAKANVYCSFCGKESAEVEQLIDGPGGIAVCDECINLLHGMIHGDAPPPGQRQKTGDAQ